jgi:hypothetical protein
VWSRVPLAPRCFGGYHRVAGRGITYYYYRRDGQRGRDMDKAPQVSLHSTAHFFLEGLNEIGIDYLFCNLGTDHGETLTDIDATPEAIRRCLAEVRGGRPAVLHVKLPVL